MKKKTVSKVAIKKERAPTKVKKVIKKKGFPSGKLPKGKEIHHVKPVSKGGKTTPKKWNNTV